MIPYDELCRALERFNQRGAGGGAAAASGTGAVPPTPPTASAPTGVFAPGEEVDLDHDAGVDISTYDDDGTPGAFRR